jgi:hypothetical protein
VQRRFVADLRLSVMLLQLCYAPLPEALKAGMIAKVRHQQSGSRQRGQREIRSGESLAYQIAP